MTKLTMRRLTSEAPDPRRIRVCWLEDRGDVLPTSATLRAQGRLFDIWHASGPEDLAAHLRERRQGVHGSRGTYRFALESVPFDLFIADWKLDDNPNPDWTSRAHTAPAAGLYSATLAATEFPQHPAAVITYTAHYEKHLPEGDLVRALSAPALSIAWARKEVQGIEPAFVARLGTSVVREAILRAAVNGDVYVPLQVQAEILSVASDQAALRRWFREGVVRMRTAWGWREFHAKSLWADVYSSPAEGISSPPFELPRLVDLEGKLMGDGQAPAPPPATLGELVAAWVRRLPTPEASFLRAASVASAYHRLSKTRRSVARHTLNRLHDSSSEDAAASSKRQEASGICKQIGISLAAIEKAATPAQQKALWPDGWSCPHLLATALSDEEKRLASCMVFLLEKKLRLVKSLRLKPRRRVDDDTGDSEEDRDAKAYATCMAAVGEALQALRGGARLDLSPQGRSSAAAVHRLAQELERHGLWEDAEGLRQSLSHHMPVTDADLARMLDPLPESLKPSSIGKGSKLGAQLDRLDPPLDLLRLVTGPDTDGVLTPREKQVLREYCHEIDLPATEFPDWLQHGASL